LWVAFQLVQAGYKVWTDLTGLLGGEDFWKQAEDVLRSTTTKCLFVLSRVSNSKEGPLQELHVAKAIARSKSLNDFVIPLRVDNLPHASFNVELGRLNAVDFELGWSHGLSRLLEKLQRDSVPRSESASSSYVSQWWKQHIDSVRSVELEEEEHTSNILPIRSAPHTIYRHSFDGYDRGIDHKLALLSFPAYRHRKTIVTFADRDVVESELESRICVRWKHVSAAAGFFKLWH